MTTKKKTGEEVEGEETEEEETEEETKTKTKVKKNSIESKLDKILESLTPSEEDHKVEKIPVPKAAKSNKDVQQENGEEENNNQNQEGVLSKLWKAIW